MSKNLNKQRTYYYLILGLFIVLNIFNTYFVTSQILNRYIAPVSRTLVGELTQVAGNMSILILFIIIAYAIFKKDKNKFIFLVVVSLFLNIVIFLLGFFNLYYSTALSVNALNLFKNPSEGIANGLVTELFGEMFLYFRILVFLPFAVLLGLTLSYSKVSKENEVDTLYLLNGKSTLIMVSSFIVLLTGSSLSFINQIKNDDFVLGSTNATKGIQNYGVYPYYISSFLGIEFDATTKESLGINTSEDIYNKYDVYNKNKETYDNILDPNNTYSNNLLLEDSVVNAHDLLNLNNEDSLTGIFKDKNLVLVQLESLNYFLLQLEQLEDNFSFMNKLFKESFVFDNYYSTVGLGGTSDSESTILTGLNMNGYDTFYRSYNFNGYDIDTIPRLFNDYESRAYHGGFEEFYNRNNAYTDLLGFKKEFYSIEDFALADGFDDPYIYHKNRGTNGYIYPHYKYDNKLKIKTPWPSEFELSDKVYEEMESDPLKKHFTFSVFMTPHTPFLHNSLNSDVITSKKLKNITKRYLNYTKYIDNLVESYFIDPQTGLERKDIDNNVYIFYSDHGSFLKSGDLSTIFNKKKDIMEERRMLQQTIAFIYAPSGVKTNDTGIHEGLITGNQILTRSNVDMYRTIGDLFGLFSEENFYFGVSGLSKEPTYALDNRIQDLVIDDINNIDSSNYSPMLISMRNPKIRNSHYTNKIINNELAILNYIRSFRMYSDLILSDPIIYVEYRKKIEELID